MKTRLFLFSALATALLLASLATSDRQTTAAPSAPNDVYLPLVMSPADAADLNVYQYVSNANGVINVPLTGGDSARVVVQDFSGVPLTGISVTALENTLGLTLIAAGEGPGYGQLFHPALISFSPGQLQTAGPNATQNLTMVSLNQADRYAGGNGIINEHLLALPNASPDWQEDVGDIEDYCDAAIRPSSWATLVGNSIQGTAAPAGLDFRVSFDVYGSTNNAAVIQGCVDLLAGPNSFQQRVISNPTLGANLFTSDPLLPNNSGVIYGQVADDGSGASLAGAGILLGGLLDGPAGGVAATESFPNGWFRLEGIAEGDYALEVNRPGYAPYSTNVSVSEGGVADAGETPIVLTDPAFLDMTYDEPDGLLNFRIYQYANLVLDDFILPYDTHSYQLPPGDYILWVSPSICPTPGTAFTTLEPGEDESWFGYCVPVAPGEAPINSAVALRR